MPVVSVGFFVLEEEVVASIEFKHSARCNFTIFNLVDCCFKHCSAAINAACIITAFYRLEIAMGFDFSREYFIAYCTNLFVYPTNAKTIRLMQVGISFLCTMSSTCGSIRITTVGTSICDGITFLTATFYYRVELVRCGEIRLLASVNLFTVTVDVDYDFSTSVGTILILFTFFITYKLCCMTIVTFIYFVTIIILSLLIPRAITVDPTVGYFTTDFTIIFFYLSTAHSHF